MQRRAFPREGSLRFLQGRVRLDVSELAERAGLDRKESGVGIGWLMRKGWAKIDDGRVSPVQEGTPGGGADEELLQILLRGR